MSENTTPENTAPAKTVFETITGAGSPHAGCTVETGHLPKQDHRWQECPSYHDDEDGDEEGDEDGGDSPVALDLRPVPLTDADIEMLREHKGWFENGYDNRDAMKVLEAFQSADMVVTWEYLDDGDEAGCSEFIGKETIDLGPTEFGYHRTGTVGVWRRIHPDVWTYLSDPEADINPEQIPSLLDTGEFAVFEDQDIADKGFIQNPDDSDDETCIDDDCEESLDDGEGFDGYCGTHADKIENHNQGGHRPVGEFDDEGDEATGPDDECPNCNGAGVRWG